MNPQKELNYNNEEIQVDVSVTSFMLAVSTFFTGFLFSAYDSFDNSVRIPMLFLIISTLSFLFTNIIFANASGEIRSGNNKGANRHASIGNIISEFLGIYLLVASLPLVVNALTGDAFLKIAVFVAATSALFIYSVSPFSIIKRYFSTIYLRILYSVVFVGIGAACFFSQEGDSTLYVVFSTALMAYLMLTTVYLLASKK